MPEETAAAEPIEASAAEPGLEAGAQPVAEAADPQGETAGAETAPAGAKPSAESDNRLLSPDVRAHLAELKAANPTLAGKIRDAFGTAAAIRREFPGGMTEARAIKQLAAELGGADGVKDLQVRVGEIEELDRLWTTKDPRAVDSMAEDYPEQFAALMPHALDAWAQRDPDGFNRNACAIVASTFQQANQDGYSPLNLMWMAEQSLATGNMEQAKAILGHLQAWAKSFQRAAAAPEQPKDAGGSADKDRADKLQQQLQQQEQRSFDASVGQAVEAFAESKMEAAIAPYIKGKQLTNGQKETLNSRVVANLTTRLQADKQFVDARKRYTAAKDKNGLVQMSKAKVEALLPGAVKDAHRWLFGGAPAPKAAPGVPAAARPGTAAAPSAGQKPWTKIAAPPKPQDVDGDRTPFEMKMRSSAVLKDGRRVYWGQNPYQGK